MGLDAYVPCRCLADGLIGEPPVDWALLEIDEGLLRVRDDTDGPDVDREAYNELRKLDGILEKWKRSCCPHPGLKLYSDRVGNWSGVRTFQFYVQCFDHGELSLLNDLIPNANGGSVEPHQSAQALGMLDQLLRAAVGQVAWFMSDSRTGDDVYPYHPTYGGILALSQDVRSGFDPEGVFVREGDVEVFRAMRVEQRIVGHSGKRPIVRFTADNGEVYTSTGIGFGRNEEHDWQVVSRPLTAEDIPCVDVLRRLFQASVETGNPVYWY